MALTILFLIVFAGILLVFNYKNKYSVLFAMMCFAIALCAITLLVEIYRVSYYSTTRVYFFSGLDAKLFYELNRRLSLTPNGEVIVQNISFVIFQLVSLAFIYHFEKYRKHSARGVGRVKRLLVFISITFIILYFVMYHPTVGYHLFLAQYTMDPASGKILLNIARGLVVALAIFTYLCPLSPVIYLIHYYRKGCLTIFFKQMIGLILIILSLDIMFFAVIMEFPLLKLEEMLRTAFWSGFSSRVLPLYNLKMMPVITFLMILFIVFVLIRFQATNFIDSYKERAIRKNLRVLQDNLRDVLHSEKNVIFNLKILAQGAEEAYGTPTGRQKLERLIDLSSSHLESLAQSINNIKDFRINTVKRDLGEAIDAALKAYPLPENIRVVKNYHCEKAYCNYDLYHVTQVIINLLENAADSLKDKADGQIELSLDASDYWAMFSISDNGSGISPKNIKKIQKPYFSTKSKQSNWGIGLSYVARVVKAHFGYLRISSQADKGTRVELLFMRQKATERKNSWKRLKLR